MHKLNESPFSYCSKSVNKVTRKIKEERNVDFRITVGVVCVWGTSVGY